LVLDKGNDEASDDEVFPGEQLSFRSGDCYGS